MSNHLNSAGNAPDGLPSSLNIPQGPASALLWQQCLQGAGVRGGNGSALDLLQRQEQQLRATRLLLQERQLQAYLGGASSHHGDLLRQGGLGGIGGAGLLAFSSPAPSSAQFSSTGDETNKQEEVDESGEIEQHKEQVSDEEYFKMYAQKAAATQEGGSSNEDADSDDGKASNESFPHKLYRMLYEAEQDGKDNVVSFLPSGRGFVIHEPRKFEEIMSRYFTTRRLASFQRQLNLYGFRRISEGKEKGGYFHKFFIKGKRSLTKRIRRKSTASRSAASTSARRFSNGSLAGTTNPSFPSLQFPGPLYGGANTGATIGQTSQQNEQDAKLKELLMASIASSNANVGALNSSSLNLNTASLLGMTRQGHLATQNNHRALDYQNVLRNATSSLLWGNNSGSSS